MMYATYSISDLIHELQNLKEELGDVGVLISSDYGDRCHTEQVLEINSVDASLIQKSAYSNSGFSISDDEITPEDIDNCNAFIILRGV
jgi:hypothetical protein